MQRPPEDNELFRIIIITIALLLTLAIGYCYKVDQKAQEYTQYKHHKP